MTAVNEVQTVSLYSFDGADAITLTFMGRRPAPIPAARLHAARSTPRSSPSPAIGTNGVAVTGYGNSGAGLADNGFQVTFNGSTPTSAVQTAGLDQPAMTVTPVAGDVTGFVGETAQGGPAANGGSDDRDHGEPRPAATAPADKTIPIRTPFTLTGSAVDADDDSMIYLWEQNDRGGAAGTTLANNTKTERPAVPGLRGLRRRDPGGHPQYQLAR